MKKERIYIYSALGILTIILLSFLLQSLPFADMVKSFSLSNAKIWEAAFFFGSFSMFSFFYGRRKWIIASFFFLLSIAWLFFQARIFEWINNLGADSFQETKNFQWEEAMFWLGTMKTVVQLDFTLARLFILTLKLALFFTLAVLILRGLKLLFNRLNFKERTFSSFIVAVSIILITSTLYFKVSGTVDLYKRSAVSYLSIKNNFTNPIPEIEGHQNDLTTLVYIGESTSSMHMSVYGYPVHTTPNLEFLQSHNERFIVFDNVYSTHTHTTPSLLEALSFGLDSNERFLPITERHRISLIEVLKKAGIDTRLFSNQAASGTNNLVASIIFNKSRNVFSTPSRLTGNLPVTVFRDKPFDDIFFKKVICSTLGTASLENKVLFLHSYAGHGFYLENIPPEFRKKPKDFKNRNPKSIIGNQSIGLVKDLEDYHAALRYIDYSIGAIYNQIEKIEKPIVLIYFSDHGEAPFIGTGHDSDRFIHEMLRVPFIIYFNRAAAKKYPLLFQRFKKLAENKNIASLSQFPSTLIELLGLKLKYDSTASLRRVSPVGAVTFHDPILVRETTKNKTYIDLNTININRDSSTGHSRAIDITDDLTNFHKLSSRTDTPGNPIICYHRSNTFAKAVRGSFTCNGLEVDLNIDSNKKLELYHAPAPNTGMDLTTVFEIVKKKKLSLWIDGKNLQERDNCHTLVEFLKTRRQDANKILVEFPTGSYRNQNLREEIDELKKMACNISYYVPTEAAKKCSEEIAKGIDFKNEKACQLLRAEIDSVKGSKMFTDISFDYSGLKAIEKIDATKNFTWNTWNITPEQYKYLRPGLFQMVIFRNNDPNDL